MLDSIYVGMTGLLGYSRGLRVIANNTANINTPGFKGSSLQFADLAYGGGSAGGVAMPGSNQLGFGLNTLGTTLSFRPGELRPTSNELDMALDGQGLFVLKHADGKLSYTRAGQFRFDTDGVLVNRADNAKVMGLDAHGRLAEVAVAGQMVHPGKPTTRVRFGGNLSATATEQSVGNITVLDAIGGEHTLSMKFSRTAASVAEWKIDLLDGATVVGTKNIKFENNAPTPDTAVLSFDYAPQNLPPMTLAMDFSGDVRMLASSTTGVLAMKSQDGVKPGTLTGTTFDAKGVAVLKYSNGQEVKGMQLALARFDTPDAVGAMGDNQFEMLDERAWHIGAAGEGGFGSLRSGMVEISNVDLSREFSDLIVMQRGYQASSQVISTANEMLQQLYSMKSK